MSFDLLSAMLRVPPGEVLEYDPICSLAIPTPLSVLFQRSPIRRVSRPPVEHMLFTNEQMENAQRKFEEEEVAIVGRWTDN